MNKPAVLTTADLKPSKKKKGALPQRGESAETVPLHFRMPADFVKEFKLYALEEDMKLCELFRAAFDAYKVSNRRTR
jgi:hypothetical protein